MQSTQDTSDISLEVLFAKSEKLRKAMYGQHAELLKKLVGQQEHIEWLTERLMRVERETGF